MAETEKAAEVEDVGGDEGFVLDGEFGWGYGGGVAAVAAAIDLEERGGCPCGCEELRLSVELVKRRRQCRLNEAVL